MKYFLITLLVMTLMACKPSLDMQTSDTFLSSLQEMIKDLPEEERLEIAKSIITLYEAKTSPNISMQSLEASRSGAIILYQNNNFLTDAVGKKIASEIVQAIGDDLNEKKPDEIIKLGDQAYKNFQFNIQKKRLANMKDKRLKLIEKIEDQEILLNKAKTELLDAQKHQKFVQDTFDQITILELDLTDKKDQFSSFSRKINSRIKIQNNSKFKIDNFAFKVLWKLPYKDLEGNFIIYSNYGLNLKNGDSVNFDIDSNLPLKTSWTDEERHELFKENSQIRLKYEGRIEIIYVVLEDKTKLSLNQIGLYSERVNEEQNTLYEMKKALEEVEENIVEQQAKLSTF